MCSSCYNAAWRKERRSAGFTSGTIVCYDDEVHFSQIRETGESQLLICRGQVAQEKEDHGENPNCRQCLESVP